MLGALILFPFIAAGFGLLVSQSNTRVFGGIVALCWSALSVSVALQQEACALQTPFLQKYGIYWSFLVDSWNKGFLILIPILTLVTFIFLNSKVSKPFVVSAVLTMVAAVQAVFLAEDIVVFYIMFEVMVLPAVFLVWYTGGTLKTTIRFLMYTLAGSLPMLLGIAMVVAYSEGLTTFTDIDLSEEHQKALFGLFCLAFLIKMPVFPFHGWQLPVYTEVPSPITALIGGLLSKVGLLGLARFGYNIFPLAMKNYAYSLGVIGAITIVFGGVMALGATNPKHTFTFGSLSHMGLMLIGLASMNQLAWAGVILLMLAHAIAFSGLFCCYSKLEGAEPEEDSFDQFGGLLSQYPILGYVTLFFTLASLGLPGLGNFPGELTILVGSYQYLPQLALVCGFGICLTSWYLLRSYQSIYLGPGGSTPIESGYSLSKVEFAGVFLLIIFSLWLGFDPDFWLFGFQTLWTGL